MSRVSEVPTPTQPMNVATVTRDQLHLMCRAGLRALETGQLEQWPDADIDTLRNVLLDALVVVQRGYVQRDEMVALQLSNAILHATQSRSTASAGVTWGAFKRAADALLSDDDRIGSIEFGEHGTRLLTVDRDEVGAVEIREMRRQ